MGIIDLLNKEITQQELLNYYNACITYTTLPSKINGCVFQYKGIYNIFIEKSLSYYKKKKTILHELAHIELNQLNQTDKDLFAFQISKYEDEADNYIKFLLESEVLKMISEGWLSKLATIITIIIMLIFTGLCYFWKIDFFSWIVISTGGSITIWWIILLIADAIRILINFIKNNKI